VALSNLWKVLFDNSKRDGISLRPPPPMEFHFHDHRQLEVGIKERKIGTSLQDYQTRVKHMWCGTVEIIVGGLVPALVAEKERRLNGKAKTD